jgi:hypothetical protein
MIVGFLLRHRALLWRYRDVVFPIALFLLRRRARATGARLGRFVLALTVVGSFAAAVWWWLHRDKGGGDDWRREWEPPPAPAPEPPPAVKEPAVPVGV